MEQEQPIQISEKGIWLNSVTKILFLILSFATVFFVVGNSTIVTNEIHRKLFILIGVLITLVLWVVSRLIDGKFNYIKGLILPSIFAVMGTTIISSILSPVPTVSFYGHGYEGDTGLSIILLFIALLFSASIFSERKATSRFINFSAIVFILLFTIQIIKSFFPNLLFGIGANLNTFVGKWNDLGIIAGVMLVFLLSMIELGGQTKTSKLVNYLLLVIALLVLVAANFTLLWWVVGSMSILIFIHNIFFGRSIDANSVFGNQVSESIWQRFLKPSLFVALIAIICIIGGREKADNTSGFIGTFTNTYFPKQVEVRPWKSTLDVYKAALSENLLFGTGPNRFYTVWNKAKIAEVNRTPFWNVDFNNGVGTIPTFMTTTGLIGSVAWAIFVLVLVFYIIRVLIFRSPVLDNYNRALLFGSAMTVLLLWLMMVMYVSESVVIFITFLITGLFVGLLVQMGILRSKTLDTAQRPTLAFVSVIVIIVLGIFAISSTYRLVQRWRSLGYFEKSVIAYAADASSEKSLPDIIKAVDISPLDVYYRELSVQKLNELSRFINSTEGKDPDLLRSRFAEIYQAVIGASKSAVDFDPKNYQNWLNLAGAYEVTIPLNIEGAYKEANEAYQKAVELSPKNPLIYLRLARLELQSKNNTKANEYLSKSIELKPDYVDALYLTAQIQIQAGNNQNALKVLEQAAILNPNNPGTLFQLGYFAYSISDFEKAQIALELALKLNKDFANAKYFLGLTYYKLGKISNSKLQFEELAKLDPESDIVKKIIVNLEEDRSPLYGIDTSGNQSESIENTR